MNLTPDEVEAVVRWYILDGAVSSGWEQSGPRDGGGVSVPWTHRTTVAVILSRCPYKIDGFAPVYLAVRAEISYDAAVREFSVAGQLAACGVHGVRVVGGNAVSEAEVMRRRMERWDRERQEYRRCVQWQPCMAWMGGALAVAGHEDPTFLPGVLGSPL